MTLAEAEALGPLQRTIVLALSTDDAPNARYDEHGLPLDAAARRALVRDRG